jgi:hypothetical protein
MRSGILYDLRVSAFTTAVVPDGCTVPAYRNDTEAGKAEPDNESKTKKNKNVCVYEPVGLVNPQLTRVSIFRLSERKRTPFLKINGLGGALCFL